MPHLPLTTAEARAYYAGRYLQEMADRGVFHFDIELTNHKWEVWINHPEAGEKELLGAPADTITAALNNANMVLEERLEELERIGAIGPKSRPLSLQAKT